MLGVSGDDKCSFIGYCYSSNVAEIHFKLMNE